MHDKAKKSKFPKSESIYLTRAHLPIARTNLIFANFWQNFRCQMCRLKSNEPGPDPIKIFERKFYFTLF